MTDVIFPDGSLISQPRADGCVQHALWNAFVDDPANEAPSWAGRWMMIQDTWFDFHDALTAQQMYNINSSVSGARLALSMGSTSTPTVLTGKPWIAKATPLLPNGHPDPKHRTYTIADAVAFAHDWAAPGRIPVVGTWARDLTPELFAKWKAVGYWLNENPPTGAFYANVAG